MKPIYRASPVKRHRRSNDELDAILAGAIKIIDGERNRITIRHLFYRLVSLKLIEKTERESKKLNSHLMKWRRAGLIRYDAFTDSTRYYRGVTLLDSAEEALTNAATAYRKNLWLDQLYYVEVWCEKDAIADVLGEAADEFGVPVFPCHGFASATSLYNASINFKNQQSRGKTVRILYFGDRDPSGLAIDANAKKSLRDDHGVEVDFVRLAITPDDIVGLNLPTRPVKKSDKRSAGWEGGCVEVDAMPMNILRDRVRNGIAELIDPHQWEQAQRVEELEKETLKKFAENFSNREPPQ